MTAFTKLSDKGQIVVPKATRERLGWNAGLDLEVIENIDSITLRKRRVDKKLSPADAVAEFRRLYQHEGAPVSLEQMNADARTTATRSSESKA